jgi:hypothetical protein
MIDLKRILATGGVLGAVLFLAGQAFAADMSVEGPNITGRWFRYPSFHDKPDPALVPPKPTELMLKPAYKADYEKMRAAQRASDARGEPLGNAGTECLPEGMPSMMSAIYPIEILQTPGQVTIIEEAMSQVRRIYLGEKQAEIGSVAPGYFGHSVGRWDNDTLDVDTIAIKTSVRGFRDTPHSDKMRLKERIFLKTKDILYDEITVEDPDVLEKPWSYTVALKRAPDYQMLEYVCENNRDYIDANGVTRVQLQDK